MGKRMSKRMMEIEAALEELLRTRQSFNLADLVDQLDIPVDVTKAVRQYKLDRLRKAVYRVGQRLGLHVFCDQKCNVIVVSTLKDAEQGLSFKMNQITGRTEKAIILMELQEEMKKTNPRRPSTSDARNDPRQMSLSDLAEQVDPSLLEHFPPRRLATVVALRAKNAEQTRRVFASMLLQDPQRLEDFEQASTHFYRQIYGLNVVIPEALFSEGVIHPSDLYQLWKQIAPALRRIAREPDLMRQVTATISSAGRQRAN